MSHGYYLEAEYESGFVLSEDDRDASPYDAGRNVYHAIVNDRPVTGGHGKLVRLSLIGDGPRYDIDFTKLPEGAKPVYFRKMTGSFPVGGGHEVWCDSHHFGWEADDVKGRPVREVIEIRG